MSSSMTLESKYWAVSQIRDLLEEMDKLRLAS